MRCFYHSTAESVALCKQCQKGLCAECATDLGHGVACKGKHEGQVQLLNDLVLRNANIQATMSRNKLLIPLSVLFLGIVFVWWGTTLSKEMSGYVILSGAGLILMAISQYVLNRKAFSATYSDSNKLMR